MTLRRHQARALAIASLALALTHQIAFADSSSGTTSKGRALLEKEGCLHCHFVEGSGGVVGPPFGGISKFRTEEDIVNTLTGKRPLPPNYPKGVFDPREFMRHVRVDKKTAESIAKYLITVSADEDFGVNGHSGSKDDVPGGITFVPREPSKQSRLGFLGYKEGGCAACHEIGGIGGRRGPSLDGVGARLSKNQIENRVNSGAIVTFGGKEYRPTEYSMPPARLPKDQVEQITEFLLTLPQKKEK